MSAERLSVERLRRKEEASSLFVPPEQSQKPEGVLSVLSLQGDGSFWLILSFHVILTDKARIIKSIKS
jgi:hypothetical protein